MWAPKVQEADAQAIDTNAVAMWGPEFVPLVSWLTEEVITTGIRSLSGNGSSYTLSACNHFAQRICVRCL